MLYVIFRKSSSRLQQVKKYSKEICMILLLELSFNKKLKSISSDNFSTYYNNYFLLFACQIEYFSGGGLERQLFVTNIVFFKLTWNQLVAIIVRLKNFTCLCNRSLHIRVNNDYLKKNKIMLRSLTAYSSFVRLAIFSNIVT